MTLLKPEDLTYALPNVPVEQIQEIITDAEAIAAIYAPCILSPAFNNVNAAKAIIKKAIVYDYEASQAKAQSVTTGPWQVQNYAPTRSGTFYSPSQIDTLRALCAQTQTPGAYSVPLDVPDTLPRY